MPSFPVEIKLEIDDREMKRYFREAVRRGKDLRPAFKRCAILMFASFDKNFRSQGRPRRWKRLTPNTVAGRRKGSSRVLQDTGRLRMSTMSRAAPGNIHKMGKAFLEMGSALPIAKYHQWGTEPYTIYPKNKKALRFMTTSGVTFAKQVQHPGLPARPFVLIQTEDERDIKKVFYDHVVGE